MNGSEIISETRKSCFCKLRYRWHSCGMAVIMLITSVGAYAGSKIEAMSMENVSATELLNRSISCVHHTGHPDSALVYLKVLSSRIGKPTLAKDEADVISRGLILLGGVYIYHYHDYARASVAFLKALELARKDTRRVEDYSGPIAIKYLSVLVIKSGNKVNMP